MRKLISIILLCAMLASALASCAWNQGPLDLSSSDGVAENAAYTEQTAWDGSKADTSWYSASASTYTISDGADLKGFINLVYGSSPVTFEGKTVKLEKDINLGNKTWSIPTGNGCFKGTFDGQGHTIGGFKMTCTEANQSLLGSIGGSAVVKNLTVESGNTLSLKATAAATGAAGVIARIVTEQGKT
ncbi:MAG: hypothetical protein IJX19_12500, partial [Clostridia bacterium]|nr:hypothetical protein [Clostridia bacterium]